MQVTMAQRAVGQGGFFAGELNVGAKPFRWIYDCGSNQCHALQREIRAVAEGGDVDLLFLSHFDSDHVGGVDRLLSLITVREVVLPYLDEAMLIITMARDAARGALSGAFVDAAGDLAAWFGSRGVERVTFVDGRDDEGEGEDGPIVPGEPGDGAEGGVTPKWTSKLEVIGEAVNDQLEKPVTLQRVPPGAALGLRARNDVILNWILAPYVHRPSARLMTAFEDALTASFGQPLDKGAIVRRAKDPDVREKLRKCYDALWVDHNLISMALYSGPLREACGNVSAGPHLRRFQHWPLKGGAWMLTGDAHLDRQGRRRGFLSFYSRFAPLVNVLMLPHHGSIHNHSDLVLGAMPALHVGYAAAGPNDYGHPHPSVRDAVEGHGRAYFHRVSHKPRTRLVMEVSLG